MLAIKPNVVRIAAAIFLLVAAFFSPQSKSETLDEPSQEMVRYCSVLGCDNHLFYNYYIQNKARFCHEKKVVSNNKRAMGMLSILADEVKKNGLPEHLSLIPLMESSLSPRASAGNSYNSAKGLWQIQTSTALDLGLSVKPVDERYDVRKSTLAASNYIKWLSTKFEGDVVLSVLAYHAGIGRIERLSKKTGTINPWYLSSLISDHEPDKDYLFKFFSYTLSFMSVGCKG
jgi:membrane-bound lytic murein transglycosylase MltF